VSAEGVALEPVELVLQQSEATSPLAAEDVTLMETRKEEQHGRVAPQYPQIPEPMYFDLVRPLGARKGEAEINTLFNNFPHSGRRAAHWAPEVEYAFLDGYSIEFELPFENQYLQEYKTALQGTFGTAFDNRMVHGWQVIGNYLLEEDAASMDALYLLGYRFNERWSVFTMNGLRQTQFNRRGKLMGIANATVFRDITPNVVVGVETNTEIARGARLLFLVIPQVHIQMGERYNLQIGMGLGKYSPGDFRPSVAFRLIREF
jgi:hypothetical protein